jgi:serine/threonine protein kinase
MAEQLEPVRRKVALKIIKLGMDTKQVVARFESERQALALMDHPHIARVFDAGATDSGRPYFVMELVKGISITEYADKNGLGLRDRLALFITVCQAVQHAHQKGIIHRDIKPTNVLVTLHDGKPVPKVIDFGIAKATSHRLTEKTIFTEFRQIVGTPQYMSPEQAEMSGLDVDTRCDIYSLGVLLYELLTGTTPIEASWLQSAGYIEMQRIIREDDPQPPSLRVSTMHEQIETVARNRRVEPRTLTRVFKGDLDWIVMKALEKDRTRRYATAGDLAADVERYLQHEPVQASPPSIIYQVRKFARRNRTSVTAGVLIAAALFSGLGLATAGFIRASREFIRASREAERSQSIARFLEDIVVTVNPSDTASHEVDVEKVLRQARDLFGNDHATVAAALDSLAMRSQHTGDLASAESLFRESSRIWRMYGEKTTSLALTLGHLGSLLRLKGDDEGAEAALRESLQISKKLPDPMQLPFCDTRNELASVLQRGGHLAEAEALVRESLRIYRLQPKLPEYSVARGLELLTQILVGAGRNDEAEQTLGESISLFCKLVPADSPAAANYNFIYGHWLRQQGRLEKAEPYLREAVHIYRNMKQPPRDYYLGALDGLFQLLNRREDAVEEATAVFHECMRNMAQMLGPDHPSLGAQMFGYAQSLGELNRSVEAIPLLIECLRICHKSPEDSNVGDLSSAIVAKRLDRSVRRIVLRPGGSKADYETALAGAVALVQDQGSTGGAGSLRGMALLRLHRFEEAAADLTEVDQSAADTPEYTVQRLACLAIAQCQSGHPAAARETMAELRKRVSEQGQALGAETRTLVGETETLLNSARTED